ncbi:MAG TPA: hypothetical protein VFT64_10870 [Rickettsiales bacterium]|nr:hypothetical protein [Rickettsiales bacterium]
MSVKTLGTLIKVHKQRLDQLRRQMVALQEELHQLEQLAARLKREHEEEIELVAREHSLASFFGSYSSHTRKKLEKIAEETARLEETIEKKRAEIAEEFGEQKKYEIAQTNLKAKLDAQEKRLQMGRLDEIATQQYMRHKEEP